MRSIRVASLGVVLVLLLTGGAADGEGTVGALIWSRSAPGSGGRSHPPRVAVSGGRVFVVAAECDPDFASCGTRFRAFSARTGRLLWQRRYGPPLGGDLLLQVQGGSLVAAWGPTERGGVVLGLSAPSGEPLWVDEFPTDGFFFARDLTVDGGRIALSGTRQDVPTDTAIVRLYRRDGTLLWQRLAEADTRAGPLALARDVLVLGGVQFPPGGGRTARLWAYDAGTGEPRWNRAFRKQISVQALTGTDGGLFAAVGRSLVALSVVDGTTAWRNRDHVPQLYDWDEPLMLVLDGRLVYQGAKGLRAVSIGDGRQLWRRGSAARPGIPAATAGEIVLGGNGQRPDHRRFAFVRIHDRDSGRRLWTDSFPAASLSDMAVTDRLVFVTGHRTDPGDGGTEVFVRAYRVR